MKKAFLILPILLAVSVAAFGQFKEQEFKEFGFKVSAGFPLVHQPTETGTDTLGHPTKIDSFDSKMINDEMYVVQVTTFTTDISVGVDDDYLERMFKSMVSDTHKMGEIHHESQKTQGGYIHTIPAAWTTWTDTANDGSTIYIHEQICIRGNHLYVLRQAYLTPSEDKDTAFLIFRASLDLP